MMDPGKPRYWHRWWQVIRTNLDFILPACLSASSLLPHIFFPCLVTFALQSNPPPPTSPQLPTSKHYPTETFLKIQLIKPKEIKLNINLLLHVVGLVASLNPAALSCLATYHPSQITQHLLCLIKARSVHWGPQGDRPESHTPSILEFY